MRPDGGARRFEYEDGFDELARFLAALGPKLVVLEATGGDEAPVPVAAGIAATAIPVAAVN